MKEKKSSDQQNNLLTRREFIKLGLSAGGRWTFGSSVCARNRAGRRANSIVTPIRSQPRRHCRNGHDGPQSRDRRGSRLAQPQHDEPLAQFFALLRHV